MSYSSRYRCDKHIYYEGYEPCPQCNPKIDIVESLTAERDEARDIQREFGARVKQAEEDKVEAENRAENERKMASSFRLENAKLTAELQEAKENISFLKMQVETCRDLHDIDIKRAEAAEQTATKVKLEAMERCVEILKRRYIPRADGTISMIGSNAIIYDCISAIRAEMEKL